jgi:hypothetical protein
MFFIKLQQQQQKGLFERGGEQHTIRPSEICIWILANSVETMQCRTSRAMNITEVY